MSMNSKEHLIKFFRENGFNCFPIPRYPDDDPEQKRADYRYKADKTLLNQEIKEYENYGVIPIKGAGTCFIDIDDKELGRKFAEENIKNGWMVIESPNGWHIPIKGIKDVGEKVFLFRKGRRQNKAAVEILPYKQYVMGAGSDVFNHRGNPPRREFYRNVGSENIFDAKGGYYEDLADNLCRVLNLEHSEKLKHDRKLHYNMRERFKQGLPPATGTSNDYFYNAGVVCHSEDMPIEEAMEKIRAIYDKWENKTRGWKNIEDKIRNAYQGRKLNPKGGRPKKEDEEFDPVAFCEELLTKSEIYSDGESNKLWENENGFLEDITKKLHKILQPDLPEMTEGMFNDIKFRLIGLAPDVPETNDDLKVFENGVYNTVSKKLILTDEIATMGFKGYNYLKPSKENEPTKFLKVMFDNVPKSEHPRLKAALKSAITPKLDSRITVIHGMSGVGKSAGLTILYYVLNQHEKYALTLEMSQLLLDPFIKAHIMNKTLVILSEMPETYKHFAAIKAITGETEKLERGFHQDAVSFKNTVKLFGTTNYLAKIPDVEKNAMYSRRLSLIHNQRETPYEIVDPDFEINIAKEEGEKIISWILNIPDEECVYEDPKTVRAEWERLSSPEYDFLETNYQINTDMTDSAISVMRLKKEFNEIYPQVVMPLKQMTETLESLGYVVRKNVVLNIEDKPIPEQDIHQKRIKT